MESNVNILTDSGGSSTIHDNSIQKSSGPELKALRQDESEARHENTQEGSVVMPTDNKVVAADIVSGNEVASANRLANEKSDSVHAASDKDVMSGCKTMKEEEKEKETEDAKRERLCRPENWEQLFEYRIMDKNRDWATVDKDKFYAEHDYSPSVSLSKIAQAEEVHIYLFSKYIKWLYRYTAGRHTFEGVTIGSTNIRIAPPYCPFFHCLDEMGAAIKNDANAASWEKANFEALRRYCTEGRVGQTFEPIREDLASDIVACDDLWAFYKPDEHVVVTDHGPGNQLCIMRIVSILRTPPETVADKYKPRGWDVSCAQLTWDGSNFRFETQLIQIPYYPGTKNFTDLRLVPLYLHPDQERIKESAQARGKKWSELCTGKPKAMQYEGAVTPLACVRNDRPLGNPEPIELSGRVMVDPGALVKAARAANLRQREIARPQYLDSNPERAISAFIGRKVRTKTGSLVDLDLSLCPAVLPVFSFEEQEWYSATIDGLKDIQWQSEAFHRLELTKSQKTLLEGLTRAHAEGQDRRSSDMITGKGRGLVFLFYGPPGVGKTLTAEALSETTKKPLYRVNLGVISSMPNWEANLDHIFACAHSWNAILLIDEAEVVLEERTVQGRHQNEWASVFLKKVEYYKGILVFTTNLINVIDQAFLSRVSIAIEYPSPDANVRLKIWKGFIERINPKVSTNRSRQQLLDQAEEWAESELNARQIRNIILTAESLAIGRGQTTEIKSEHIQTVLDHTIEFQEKVGRGRSDRSIYSHSH